MNIKTATRIAIASVAIGMVMALVGPFMQDALFKDAVESGREAVERAKSIQRVYWAISHLMRDGGVLLFLIVLNSKQSD